MSRMKKSMQQDISKGFDCKNMQREIELTEYLAICQDISYNELSTLHVPKGFQVAQWYRIYLPMQKLHAGDVGSIPGSERFPGGGNGNPLQYSCLVMDKGA